MSLPNKDVDEKLARLRHDLKPVLLGLRATIQALTENRSTEARELVEEIEKRVITLINELKG